MQSADDAARAAALDFAQGLKAFWEARLGDGLLGVYLIGSLAHGGFNRRYSDIDMAVIAEEGLDDITIDAMKEEAARLSPELAPKLSLFWADREFSVGRFPPLDLMDYLDGPLVLSERQRLQPARPTLEEVRTYLRGRPFTQWAERAAAFVELDKLDPENHKPYLRAHLYPARFVYSWITGAMGSNDDAVSFVEGDAPDGLDVALIGRALQCRHDASDPDMLFPDRTVLPDQVAACAALIGLPE
jgi:predicted nucleotidyltransferase